MADIPSSVPVEIRAGDTIRWRRAPSDFPASSGWQLGYALVGTTSIHSVTAAADGDGFAVEVGAGVTAAWPPGTYRVQEYVERSGDRHTLGVTSLRVLQNLAAAQGGLDTRSHARKVLDAIEAWLERKAPTAASFQYEGRRLENYPLPELLALRDRYRAEVRREEAGGGTGRLLVRL